MTRAVQTPVWKRVRAVVFDIDGTLYDAGPLRRRMGLELLLHCARHPKDLALVRLLQTFRRNRERLAEAESANVIRLQYSQPAAALGLQPASVASAVETWLLERPLRHLPRYRARAVDAFFAQLRAAGLRLAVLSDYPTRAKMSALDLAVDVEVGATDPEVDRFKPHPAGLARALELLDCEARDCLLIGDRDDRDGEAARRLGVPFLHRAAVPGRAPGSFTEYTQLLDHL